MFARLQRIVYKIHQYNIAHYYRKGKSMSLPDCLSRNPEYRKHIGSDLEDLKIRFDVADIEVSTYIQQSALEEIVQATKSDAMLRDITEFIAHGWAETDAGLPEDLQLHYFLKDELTNHADCVIKGNRVVVPEAHKETLLWRLHRAHLGVSQMKAVAPERVYLPTMHRSIEFFVLRCKMSQEVGLRWNLIEPLQPHPILG